MAPEHRLLLALSHILKPSYPHLEELHAEVEKRAHEGGRSQSEPAPPDPTAEKELATDVARRLEADKALEGAEATGE